MWGNVSEKDGDERQGVHSHADVELHDHARSAHDKGLRRRNQEHTTKDRTVLGCDGSILEEGPEPIILCVRYTTLWCQINTMSNTISMDTMRL